MNKKENKVIISFHVEGEVERQLIYFIVQKYKLHRICSIEKANITSNKKNIQKIIDEVIKYEERNWSYVKKIIILVFDKEAKDLKKSKKFDYVQISYPSIDHPIALSLGIKVNKNDNVEKIKAKIKKKLKTKSENYLSKEKAENKIDYKILFSELGILGDFFYFSYSN